MACTCCQEGQVPDHEISEFEKEQIDAGNLVGYAWIEDSGWSVTIHEVPELVKAIMACRGGDHTKLTEYLRTHQISLHEQAELAWAIDEANEASRPKRTQSLEQFNRAGQANLAEFFFKTWHEENTARGLNDYGHRAAMRAQACKLVAELEGGDDDDAAAIEALLKRPASRRTQK